MSMLAAIRAAVTSSPEPEPAARPAPAGGTYAEGFAAATARFSSALTAEGIKGNASLMDAAVSLAARSPDMSAEDVVTFVIENVKPAARASSPASLSNRVMIDPITGAKSTIWDDPLGAMIGGGLPPTAADGWQEAIGQAAGKVEPKQ